MTYETNGTLRTGKVSPTDETIEINDWGEGSLVKLVDDNGMLRLQTLSPPNTEADDKLLHRWAITEVDGTLEDSIGSADGTNNGITEVKGDYAGGIAGDGGSGSDYNVGAFRIEYGLEFCNRVHY